VKAKRICVRCIVSGRVQGVFFRVSTQRQAQRLGINGHAKNLADGSVEVLACGETDAVQQLCAWLWVGPPSSSVTAVECEVVDVPVPDLFSTM
jgi:acylphosphatase